MISNISQLFRLEIMENEGKEDDDLSGDELLDDYLLNRLVLQWLKVWKVDFLDGGLPTERFVTTS